MPLAELEDTADMLTPFRCAVLGGGDGERFQMTDDPKDTITAVIPAFNEEKTIGRVVEKAMKHAGIVIVVDDGSVDRTAEIAAAAGAHVIRFPRNGGKGNALGTGLTTAASGEIH